MACILEICPSNHQTHTHTYIYIYIYIYYLHSILTHICKIRINTHFTIERWHSRRLTTAHIHTSNKWLWEDSHLSLSGMQLCRSFYLSAESLYWNEKLLPPQKIIWDRYGYYSMESDFFHHKKKINIQN